VFLAMVCHVTHLALAVVIIVGMAGLGWVAGRRPPLALAGLAATVLAAFLANIGFNLAVEKVLHAPVLSKPFLLARLLDDGTAVGYLNRHCAERRYALCRHLDKFPESGNDFLWSTDPRKGVLQFANLQELLQIQKEADGIIIGSVMERPLTQLRISLINACRQFVTVGASDYDNMSLTQLNGASPSSAFFPIVQGYAKARAARQGIPYAVISALMAGAYFASLAVLAVYGARQLRQGLGRLRQRLSAAWDDPFGWAALAVIVAVIANAANCGALSGVFDRYQGRVAWDVVFIAWLSLARWRRTPEQAFAA
jgi:hypothetical protein